MMIQYKSERYTKILLDAIARLRSVREIKDLWQETADILGSALEVSHCLIVDQPLSDRGTIVAEYHQQTSFKSMCGKKASVAEITDARKALTDLNPIWIENLPTDRPFIAKSLLIMATSDNAAANGLIYLYQYDRYRSWTDAELEFVQYLAEQVGYYIARLSVQQELAKSRKQLTQTNRTIENFLQNISDKLRNPLNGIIGSLNLILDDVFEDPIEQKEFIQDAHNSSIKLLRLVNDLLHFSNLRENQIQRNIEKPVKLTNILKEVERLTQPRANCQQLYLNFIKPDTFDELILSANESRLLQVFLNVVGNAIKFTHYGGVTISYEAIVDKIIVNNSEYPGYVEIRVCDTGIGVPTEYLPRVFDPFFQVHDPRTSRYAGTGLGLSISKKLLEIMGGKVHFYSMGEGLGSTTIFTVPLYQTPVKTRMPSSKVLNMVSHA